MRLQVYGGKKGYLGSGTSATFRPMTLDEVKSLQYGDRVWFKALDGDARTLKVNGKPKVWKRTPSRVALPVKYGMYEYGTFTEYDVEQGRLLVPIKETS